MSKDGIILRKSFIEEDALNWGEEYAVKVQKAIEKNNEFKKGILETASVMKSIKGADNNSTYIKAKEREIEITKKQGDIWKEQIQLENQLINIKNKNQIATESTSRAVIKERVELETTNRALKQQAREQLGLVDAYEKLNQQRNNAQRNLANLLAGEKATNAEVRKAQNEFDRLEGKIKKVDTATNNYTKNIGNYKSGAQALTSTLRDLISALGVVGGITAFVGIAKNIFDVTKELNSMNIALRTVTNGEADFIKQKQFLTEIAERNGLEIKSLTKTYTQFYIAAKDKLSGKEIQSIFDKVSKSASLMGLSVEQQEGAFLALQQMMSKGKVQAEELRGQLGERLPGAFGIMAKSMGVTTAQLDKMLKDGKVIASEVLPKFAEELEKTYGADKVKKIESIQAAQNRLSNAWVKFIEDNTGDLNQRLAKAIGFVADNLETIIKVVGIASGAFIAYRVTSIAVDIAQKAYTATVTALRIAKIALTQGIAAARVEMGLFNATTAANPIGALIAVLAIAIASWYAFSDAVDESVKSQKALEAQTKSLKEAQDDYNKQGDEFFKKQFKNIEDEMKLRKAKGENDEKLSQEEIGRKKAVVQAEIDSNDFLIGESEKRIVQAGKETKDVVALQNKILEVKKQIAGFGDNATVGREMLKSQLEGLEEIYNKKKLTNDLDKNGDRSQVKLLKDRNAELLALQDSFNKEKEVKTAEELEKERKKREDAAKKARAAYLANLKKQEDDAYALQKFRFDRTIELEQEIVDNEKKSVDDRINFAMDIEQIKKASAERTLQHELLNNALSKIDVENTSIAKIKIIKKEAEEKAQALINGVALSQNATNAEKLIYEKYLKEKEDVDRKSQENKQKLIDAEVANVQRKIDAELLAEDTKLNQTLEAENKLYLATFDSNKNIEEQQLEHERKILEIKRYFAKQGIEAQIKAIEELLLNEEISAEKRAEVENKLARLRKELTDVQVENSAYSTKQILLFETENFKKIEEASKELAHELMGLANAIFEARIQNIDAEIERSEAYYDRQSELAGNDKVQKDLIAKEAEKKRQELEAKKRKEQHKQAVFNKALSITEAGLNMAKAITAALATTPPASFALAAITAGIAAVQLAAIIATPIPKYKHGRKGGKAEFAEVGDGFVNEVIEKKDGRAYITPNKPTLTYLEEGDKVHSSVDEYKRLQRASLMASLGLEGKKASHFQANQQFQKSYDKELVNEMKLTRKAIEKNKSNITVNTPKIDIPHSIWAHKNTNWS